MYVCHAAFGYVGVRILIDLGVRPPCALVAQTMLTFLVSWNIHVVYEQSFHWIGRWASKFIAGKQQKKAPNCKQPCYSRVPRSLRKAQLLGAVRGADPRRKYDNLTALQYWLCITGRPGDCHVRGCNWSGRCAEGGQQRRVGITHQHSVGKASLRSNYLEQGRSTIELWIRAMPDF